VFGFGSGGFRKSLSSAVCGLSVMTRRASGGNWVGLCEPLKLTVQAETWADLMEDIGLTLDALMRDLLESNELQRLLNDRGWKLYRPIPNRQDEVRFDVRFFAAMMANDQARASSISCAS
jgi:hypothetical protein